MTRTRNDRSYFKSPLNVNAALCAALFFFMTPGAASARSVDEPPVAPHPEICAVLEKYSGATQIVDDAQLTIIDLHEKAAIPCGSWVSVESGWSEIRHANGFLIHLREGTYIQVTQQEDPVVLYRGEIFAQANGGSGELRVLTPNGRIRLSRGSIVASFSQSEQRTELVAVDGSASLENRFEASRRMQAKAGQMTALDFKVLRVIPAVAKPVATTSLQAKLKELHVPLQERDRAVAMARKSRTEDFNPALPEVPASPTARVIAHRPKGVYPAIDTTAELRQKVNEHLAGGDVAASEESDAPPARVRSRSARRKVRSTASVDTDDGAQDDTKKDDQERRRLIEDLSKISNE
jgi:hypothetical protein